MRRALRRFTEWTVYGFLRWFTSFDSVWQTTLVCIGGTVAEDVFPNVDRGHLLFLLLLSLYATFTQNGLGHSTELTSRKVDEALATIDRVVDDNYVATQLLVQLAKNDDDELSALVEMARRIDDNNRKSRETLERLEELARLQRAMHTRIDTLEPQPSKEET